MTIDEPDGYKCGACGFTRESSRGVKSHIGHKKKGRRTGGHTDETQVIPLYAKQENEEQDVECPNCGKPVKKELLPEHIKQHTVTKKVTDATRQV